MKSFVVVACLVALVLVDAASAFIKVFGPRTPTHLNGLEDDYGFPVERLLLNSIADEIGPPTADDQLERRIRLHCRFLHTSVDGELVTVADAARLTERLNVTTPLAIFIHGWMMQPRQRWMRRLFDDYAHYFRGNICALDWSDLSTTGYDVTVQRSPIVGRYLAKLLHHLEAAGVARCENLMLIGFSMGAHIAGMASRVFGGRVAAIYGMDPAGTGFTRPEVLPKEGRLDPSDAQYVQCIHTSNDGLGTEYPCGHQDFYINGGWTAEAGCLWSLGIDGVQYLPVICAHVRSLERFRESFNPAKAFVGHRCHSYKKYLKGCCARKPTERLGPYSSRKYDGRYYMITPENPVIKSISTDAECRSQS